MKEATSAVITYEFHKNRRCLSGTAKRGGNRKELICEDGCPVKYILKRDASCFKVHVFENNHTLCLGLDRPTRQQLLELCPPLKEALQKDPDLPYSAMTTIAGSVGGYLSEQQVQYSLDSQMNE